LGAGPAGCEKRPLAGWGYGKKIYRDPRPFEGGGKPTGNYMRSPQYLYDNTVSAGIVAFLPTFLF